VAKKHGEVSRHMFANNTIDSITNGVHAVTWTAPSFQALFDKYIAGWRDDNFSLRYALRIPGPEIWAAHMECKKRLVSYVNHETNSGMDDNIFTLGFARRAAAYKRADLLFQDVERLKRIASQVGAFQIVFAGKAHPADNVGKKVIQSIFQMRDALKKNIRIAYLPEYNMALGKTITSGVDLWLNTPEPPMEASGTSGMKAAINGVPSLSVLDGWWIEGCIEGVTGWAIDSSDASSLYEKLEKVILPLFYQHHERFIHRMLHSIALNGAFFNTQRMLQQYIVKAYFE
jgi:glycogen phosphorylase